jgi:hypothetical protein
VIDQPPDFILNPEHWDCVCGLPFKRAYDSVLKDNGIYYQVYLCECGEWLEIKAHASRPEHYLVTNKSWLEPREEKNRPAMIPLRYRRRSR